MNDMIVHKCPVCNWTGTYLPFHILNTLNESHKNFINTIIKIYVEEKMSCPMIGELYKITHGFVGSILKKSGVKIRNRQQAAINAIQQNRISAPLGYCGYRKGLTGIFRSSPEANFARVLEYEKIPYKREILYDLYDEHGKLLCSYFLDFLLTENQGVEIKGYLRKDGNFPGKDKINMFIKQYPHIKLKVFFCSSKEWQEFEKKYSKLIPLWESENRNLKTNPEIFGVDVL